MFGERKEKMKREHDKRSCEVDCLNEKSKMIQKRRTRREEGKKEGERWR